MYPVYPKLGWKHSVSSVSRSCTLYTHPCDGPLLGHQAQDRRRCCRRRTCGRHGCSRRRGQGRGGRRRRRRRQRLGHRQGRRASATPRAIGVGVLLRRHELYGGMTRPPHSALRSSGTHNVMRPIRAEGAKKAPCMLGHAAAKRGYACGKGVRGVRSAAAHVTCTR